MALSSRARSFSVEALVGKRKLEEPGATEDKEHLRDPAEKRSKSAAPLSPACAERPPVQVELQGGDLWRRFHEIGTEMIITKAGRRMFPSVRVKVKGLDPGKQYYIAMDIIPVDSKRYRYVYHSSQWMVAGNTDHSCITPRLYIHPDSPCSGETWMRQIINFDRVKLTNNEMDDKGHVILQSMHKYKPRVHVIVQDASIDLSQIQSLPAEGVRTFSFKETEFTTVTAYQNQQITKLKIDRNPFAKGFRDPGRNRGVLDGLLESYPWRPALAIDFKALSETAGKRNLTGHSGSSPITSSGGAPSPLLSPSSSPPAFHLPAGNLGLPYSENYLHNINLPLCYRVCPTSILRPRSILFPSQDKQAYAAGPLLSPLVLDVPILSAFGISKSNKLESSKGPCVQAFSPPAQMLYGLPTTGNVLPSRETLHCSLHPSYGLVNFSVPPHFLATANHFKMADTLTASHRDGRPNSSRWPSPLNHCL
ncbi:T-box transcription factor TBX22 [Aquarana catesbeiana]|uniref:T-box transcription factor TBX22 n=1 Tax=Aquarana catesbeiana TaxID=8400 RepID=UPI003CCA409E